MAYRPLEGVKVLDLTRMIPGDLATRKLADLGADVVKVEEPGRGDYLRRIPPLIDGESVAFVNLNRNKKSIELDLRTSEGLACFHDLARVADVIVEVSHPGRFLELGIDFAGLRHDRPELVVCSITGFGQTGPLAQLPSHGLGMDALCALAPIITTPEGGRSIEIQVGTTLAGEVGALNAALAVVAAVFHARETGAGAWIDASCWDAGAELHRNALVRSARSGGQQPARDFNRNSLYGLYRCADDEFVLIAAIERKFWENFCRGVHRPDLVGAWVSPENGEVDFGAPELRTTLEKVFVTAPAQTWFERFVEWDVPGAIVLRASDLAAFPHTIARGLVDPDWPGAVPLVLDPIRWMGDGTRPGANAAPPPAIGADTNDVLARWLGVRQDP